MIEVNIHKDIASFEAPCIGPFTFRQTVCITVAAPICWAIYHYLAPVISTDLAGMLVAIPAVFAWALGWWKPFGMKAEKYMKAVFIGMVLAPRTRKYKIRNFHDTALQDYMAQDKPQKKEKSKVKYKVSKEAVR